MVKRVVRRRSLTPEEVETERRRLLALLHIAAKDLKLGEDLYRDFLEQVSGKRSAKDMDLEELQAALKHLEKRGWKPAQSIKFSPRSRDKPDKDGRDKIVAMWITLGKAGVVNRSHDALNAFVKKMTNCERVEWLTYKQSSKVIEALKAMEKRSNVESPTTAPPAEPAPSPC